MFYIMKLLYMYITIVTKTEKQKHVARKASFALYGLLTNVNKSSCYKIIYVSIIKCFKCFKCFSAWDVVVSLPHTYYILANRVKPLYFPYY